MALQRDMAQRGHRHGSQGHTQRPALVLHLRPPSFPAHSQGACVSTGRVRWPCSVARWRCGPRHGASGLRGLRGPHPQRRRGGAGADALVQVVLLEAPAPGLQRVVETRPGGGVLTFCFQEVPRARSLFEMLAIVVR